MSSHVPSAVRRSLATMPSVPPLVAANEIGDMLGVSRQRVTQLAATESFPAPVAVLSVGRIWLREDIVAWAQQTGRTIVDAGVVPPA